MLFQKTLRYINRCHKRLMRQIGIEPTRILVKIYRLLRFTDY
jgi:hypothetical protein